MVTRLSNKAAKQLVNDWLAACRRLHDENPRRPSVVSISGREERYLDILQQMIADKIEQILNESNSIP